MTEITPAEAAAFARQTELLPARFGLDLKDAAIVDHDVFSSFYNPGKLALLVAWKDAEAASAWTPKRIDGVGTLRHRRIRIVRDYGRFDRREAPQFYPEVKPANTKHAEAASFTAPIEPSSPPASANSSGRR